MLKRKVLIEGKTPKGLGQIAATVVKVVEKLYSYGWDLDRCLKKRKMKCYRISCITRLLNCQTNLKSWYKSGFEIGVDSDDRNERLGSHDDPRIDLLEIFVVLVDVILVIQ